MELFGFDYIFISHQRVFWLYLLSALLIAFLYMILYPNTLIEYKNRTIWWHSSAQLDYRYFVIISVIKALVILPLILSSKDVSLWFTLTLQDMFGFQTALHIGREMVVVLYTLAVFIVGDFTRYWLHRALHLVPFLWRVHSIHHSAEVLNPLTFYRVHPIENILFGIRYALSVGLITGLFIYLFGAKIGMIEIVGANLFVFVSGVLGSNLRHSHIPLRYGDMLERVFISPYQHQLHHSKEFTHRNFGGTLALWDWMFRTLRVQSTRVDIEYGIKDSSPYKTIGQMLLRPFCKVRNCGF